MRAELGVLPALQTLFGSSSIMFVKRQHWHLQVGSRFHRHPCAARHLLRSRPVLLSQPCSLSAGALVTSFLAWTISGSSTACSILLLINFVSVSVTPVRNAGASSRLAATRGSEPHASPKTPYDPGLSDRRHGDEFPHVEQLRLQWLLA